MATNTRWKSWKRYILNVDSLAWYSLLATESPLKMMKSAFYFMLKTLPVLMIFKFLFLSFGHVELETN